MKTTDELAKSPATRRLEWVDNLRTVVILLAINMHACVTYGRVGHWYYMSPYMPQEYERVAFAFWEAHLQSFFMGIMFFVAGYYADRALVKKGAAHFAKERLRRLGIPVLIYLLVIHPLIIFGMHPGTAASTSLLRDYGIYLTSGEFIGSSGPMWFAFALLGFCVVFAVVARWIPPANPAPIRIRYVAVLALAAGVGLIAFLIRLVQPLGTAWLNFQLCYFAQYVVAFPLGVWVSRRDSLAELATNQLSRRIGVFGTIFSPLALVVLGLASVEVVKAGLLPHQGGWNGYALSLAVWEQVTGFSLSLGILYIFAKKFDFKTTVTKWLADRSFAVYMFHAPILVGMSVALQKFQIDPIAMAVAMTILTAAASFLVADMAKRLPWLREVV